MKEEKNRNPISAADGPSAMVNPLGPPVPVVESSRSKRRFSRRWILAGGSTLALLSACAGCVMGSPIPAELIGHERAQSQEPDASKTAPAPAEEANSMNR
ncbi:MAG: hypothetical protein JW818_18185 [Pirellulales bacterium]|nr:hypothetical protein [Pirellulales bacterium]